MSTSFNAKSIEFLWKFLASACRWELGKSQMIFARIFLVILFQYFVVFFNVLSMWKGVKILDRYSMNVSSFWQVIRSVNSHRLWQCIFINEFRNEQKKQRSHQPYVDRPVWVEWNYPNQNKSLSNGRINGDFGFLPKVVRCSKVLKMKVNWKTKFCLTFGHHGYQLDVISLKYSHQFSGCALYG